MIRQLRPFYTAEELAKVYNRPYDHTRWADHIIRVQTTIHVARHMRDMVLARTAADLSCGDGAVLRGLDLDPENCHYGDMVSASHLTMPPGPIAETINHLYPVGLFICSETLEHVEEPLPLLQRIRKKASALILSTPEGEDTDGNPEHYWGWDRADIAGLLAIAGWNTVTCTILDPMVAGGYTYQIWGCT